MSRLSRSDWTDAALSAMARHGSAGVNVEQLARTLGATKGSYYHHFENRQALLEAALARWEEIVEGDLVGADAIDDPLERLIRSSLAGLDSSLDGFVDIALASSVEPAVRATLARINARRIDYLAATLQELGFCAEEAHDRATAGLATYLGLFLLQHVSGERLEATKLRSQITQAVEAMVGA